MVLRRKSFSGTKSASKIARNSLGHFHCFFKGASLEFGAVGAVDQLDVVTLGGEFCNFLLGDFVAFVGGVIQHLDFVLVLGVVDGAHGFEQALDAVCFVKDGELCGDLGEICHGVFTIELQNLFAVGKSRSAAILQEEIDAIVTAETVNDQSDACDDVDDEHNVE